MRHFLEIEKVQNVFYRSLLKLPANTPGYAIRQELCLENMQLTIFKLLIHFIIKILKMPDDGLSKIYVLRNRLDSEKSNILSKYNWVRQVVEFFGCINELKNWKNLSFETNN